MLLATAFPPPIEMGATSRLLSEDQLQPVAIGVAEVDAPVVAGPAADRDTMRLQLRLKALIGAVGDLQRKVVKIAADGPSCGR